ASERASDAAAIKFDPLQHLPSFANAHATFVGDIGVPDGALGIEADAVGDAVAKVGPHSPPGQVAVHGDVESREPFRVGLGDDQHRVVWRYEHAVREREAVRHLASQTVGGDQGHDSGSKRLAGHEVEAAAVDVGVAPTVYYQLVSCWGLRDAA